MFTLLLGGRADGCSDILAAAGTAWYRPGGSRPVREKIPWGMVPRILAGLTCLILSALAILLTSFGALSFAPVCGRSHTSKVPARPLCLEPFPSKGHNSLPFPSRLPLSPGATLGGFGYGSQHKPSWFFGNGRSASSCLTAFLEEEQTIFLSTRFWDRRPLPEAPRVLWPGLTASWKPFGREGESPSFCSRAWSVCSFTLGSVGDYDPLKKTHKDLECWNDREMNSLMQ